LHLSVWVRMQKYNQQNQDHPSVAKYGNVHRAPFWSVFEVSNKRAESAQEFFISDQREVFDEVKSHSKRCETTDNQRKNRK
jgi:hypothetical protein